jgi:hypothetical protein
VANTDGTYLVHAWANSRSGIKSILTINRMSPDGTKLLDDGKMVFDGRANHPTIEGPKLYKPNVGREYPVQAPQTTDEFNANKLGFNGSGMPIRVMNGRRFQRVAAGSGCVRFQTKTCGQLRICCCKNYRLARLPLPHWLMRRT